MVLNKIGTSRELPDRRHPGPSQIRVRVSACGAECCPQGGRVDCAGIHMSDIPGFPYTTLWEECELICVANLTRQDGLDFLAKAPAMVIVSQTTAYPLREANEALADLRAGRFEGAAVLLV